MISKIFFICILVSITYSLGAQYYIDLGDNTGFNTELNVEVLNEAAFALVETLPNEYRDSFKVLTKAFYVPSEYFQESSDGLFQKLKEQVQEESPYYLLIAVVSDKNNLYKRFIVDINLPDITNNGCISGLNLKAISLVERTITESFAGLNNSPIHYAKSVETSISSLANFISNAIICCNQNANISECLLCHNSEFIIAELHSMNFRDTSISNIRSAPSASNQYILDFAKKKFKIDNRTTVNFSDDFEIILDSLIESNLTVQVFITDDEIVCTSTWDSLKTVANSNTYDVVIWYHVHENNNGQSGLLFCSIITKEQSRIAIINIIKALGASVSDAFLQALVIYLMDDEVITYWGAFKKVNYLESTFAGLCGLIAVNEKLVEAMGAAASATGTVISNSFLDPEYTFEEGLKDFSIHFLISYIGVKSGAALGVTCKKIGADYFTEKSLSKLSRIFGESPSSHINFVRLAWKLEAANVTTHFQRGNVFENLLNDLYYLGNNFWHTPSNFKAVDFYRSSDYLAVSLKTTILTEKSSLKSLLKTNIMDLQQIKLDKRIAGNRYVESVRLSVIVPNDNKAIVNTKIQEIMTELDPNNYVVWEVKSMEDFIN